MYNVSYLQNGTVQDISIGLFTTLPLLIPFISIFEFFVILLVGSAINSRKTGYTNILGWATLSAMVTSTSMVLLSGIFSSNEQYVAYALPTIIVWLLITSMCALGMFLSRDE